MIISTEVSLEFSDGNGVLALTAEDLIAFAEELKTRQATGRMTVQITHHPADRGYTSSYVTKLAHKTNTPRSTT